MKNLIDNQGNPVRGWIREPVVRVNHMDYALRTPTGRLRSKTARRWLFKQFVFIGINTPDILAGLAVVDLQYAANGFFYVYDKHNRCLTEIKNTALPGRVRIAPSPENLAAEFRTRRLQIGLSGKQVSARGDGLALTAELLPSACEPLRICTRTGFRGWTFTRKQSPIPLSGRLQMGERSWQLDPTSSLGIMDWTAGYLRRETFWNWAAIAAVLPDGRRLGLNLSCGVNETEATENAFWIDDRLVKVDTVQFAYDEQEKDGKWRIFSADGRVDLVFTPADARRENLNALVVVSRFTQYVGTFSGVLKDEQANEVRLESCPGWTEEHFARW